MAIRLNGSVPDPPHSDHTWELIAELDGDGDPYVSVTINDRTGSGLACLTPEQARLAAGEILAIAGRLEASLRVVEQKRESA